MQIHKFLLFFLLLQAPSVLYAQDKPDLKKHEIGIDVANILTFIKKNNQSYLLNYKYLIRDKIRLRAGLNLEISNGSTEAINPDLRAGVQKEKSYGRWSLFYGVDGSFRYFKNNSLDAYQYRYGIAPIFGVQYFLHERISVSTEGTLNLYYYNLRDKSSFDPNANSDYFSLSIGSVGMLFLYFHF